MKENLPEYAEQEMWSTLTKPQHKLNLTDKILAYIAWRPIR